jgi:hypothetical protein
MEEVDAAGFYPVDEFIREEGHVLQTTIINKSSQFTQTLASLLLSSESQIFADIFFHLFLTLTTPPT